MDFDPTPWTNWLALFIALSAVITLLARWIAKGARLREEHAQQQRNEMVQLIKDVTYQIRTDANGGQSLFDLTNTVKALDQKVDLLVENQTAIRDDVVMLKAAVVQLENEAEGIE